MVSIGIDEDHRSHLTIAEPEISQGTSGSTFSHVFGTNTTPFELLVVKRKIMGPCWLEVKEAALSTSSVSPFAPFSFPFR
jgi:hypothetical protein